MTLEKETKMSEQKQPRIDVREPSTWSGIGVAILGGLFGLRYPEIASPEFGAAVLTVIAGVVSIFRHERKG